MIEWHHWLNEHGFVWTPGVGDGQGGLSAAVHGVAKSCVYLSNWTELNWMIKVQLHSLTLKFQWYRKNCFFEEGCMQYGITTVEKVLVQKVRTLLNKYTGSLLIIKGMHNKVEHTIALDDWFMNEAQCEIKGLEKMHSNYFILAIIRAYRDLRKTRLKKAYQKRAKFILETSGNSVII